MSARRLGRSRASRGSKLLSDTAGSWSDGQKVFDSSVMEVDELTTARRYSPRSPVEEEAALYVIWEQCMKVNNGNEMYGTLHSIPPAQESIRERVHFQQKMTYLSKHNDNKLARALNMMSGNRRCQQRMSSHKTENLLDIECKQIAWFGIYPFLPTAPLTQSQSKPKRVTHEHVDHHAYCRER